MLSCIVSALRGNVASEALRGTDSQPFEHTLLEAVLRESVAQKQDRFTRLQLLTARAMADERVAGLGAWFNTTRQAQEHALYTLLTLSNSLQALDVEVSRLEGSVSGLLSQDEDLAMLYLSHRSAHGAARPTHQHSEVEIMLETFATQLDDLLMRIRSLTEDVALHRTLEELKLRNERNRIMRVELLMSVAAISIATSTAVSGVFGMNLTSGCARPPLARSCVPLTRPPRRSGGRRRRACSGPSRQPARAGRRCSRSRCSAACRASTGGSGATCCARCAATAARAHRPVARARCAAWPRAQVALERSLAHLDEAYYALRASGAIGDLEPGAAPRAGITRAELRNSLRKIGSSVGAGDSEAEIEAEIDGLCEVLDVDSDGQLSADELISPERGALSPERAVSFFRRAVGLARNRGPER